MRHCDIVIYVRNDVDPYFISKMHFHLVDFGEYKCIADQNTASLRLNKQLCALLS